jgi:hypothetical protein
MSGQHSEPRRDTIARVRNVCRARDVDGLTFEVIAQHHGISRVAVRKIYQRWKDWAAERRMTFAPPPTKDAA